MLRLCLLAEDADGPTLLLLLFRLIIVSLYEKQSFSDCGSGPTRWVTQHLAQLLLKIRVQSCQAGKAFSGGEA